MENCDIEAKLTAQAEMFANRLKKRLRHLSKWAKRTGTEAFRLYDRDIPEIPLVLDLYGDAVSGALYKRPYEKDESDEAIWLAAMREVVAQLPGLEPDSIIIKQRERQYGQAQYERITARGLTHEIREGGLRFKVNLSDYLDTGLFLDRRAMRRMIRADSDGKRVLNLFCYTGSFSVFAANGGAESTDSVDLSNTYLDWAQDNFELNGLDAQKLRLEEYFSGAQTACPHRLIRADVATFLHRATAARQRWDMIILDPPAFSNSKMARADFDLQRDYGATLACCLALLESGGKLWFSAGARSFKATAPEIEALLAGRFPGVTVTDISDKTVDEDFRGKKLPKTFTIKVDPEYTHTKAQRHQEEKSITGRCAVS
jgi:23S rRNA G2069 N7-methylase RlmK/C1962 C5-methylase RlmI